MEKTAAVVIDLFRRPVRDLPHPLWAGRDETRLRADLARAVLELPYADLVALTYSLERLRDREK